MKKRILKKQNKAMPPPYDPSPDKIPNAFGVYHDFWFFPEGERAYTDYKDLLGRKDASVHLSDDVANFLAQTLMWVPSVNPAGRVPSPGQGLNFYGPTVINQTGGERFSRLCLGWAQIFAQGPDLLILTHGTTEVAMPDRPKPPRPYRFKIARDPLVRDLKTLAEWGEKAATGDFFILHLGI